MSETAHPRSDPIRVAGRLAGAVRRRATCVHSRLTGARRRAPAGAALDWLLGMDAGSGAARPGTIGACIETLLEYGCPREAEQWTRRLIALQRDDGSLPNRRGDEPSIWDTIHALGGFLALADEIPEAADAACRAGTTELW